MDAPMDTIPENPTADAKDALREAGIVTGPDRYGNWFVPCGTEAIASWRPGDPVEERALVRNNGAVAGGPCSMRWDWIAGCWVENVEGWQETGDPLPCIY